MGQQTARAASRAPQLASALIVAATMAACGGGGGSEPAHPAIACAEPVRNVVLLGDSTMRDTMGLLQVQLDKLLPGRVKVHNGAISGSTLGQLLNGRTGTYAAWPAPIAGYDLAVVNSGLNDLRLGASPEAVGALYALIASPSVLVQTPVQAREPLTDQLVQRLAALQRAAGPVIDVQAFTASAPAAEIPDGIHPTPALYERIVAEVQAPAVAASLQAMQECRS